MTERYSCAMVAEIDALHHIAQQVFFRRTEAGWTQDQLAERADMTQAQITAVECGRANPTVRTLAKLAFAFSCTVHDLALPAPAEEVGSCPNPLHDAGAPRKGEG